MGLPVLHLFGLLLLARIEEAIPAQGKLEPKDAVKEVQIPVNGVVKEVFVKDGQQVKKGDLMMVLDSTSVNAQLNSQKKIRNSLIQENQFYYSVLKLKGRRNSLKSLSCTASSTM